LRVPIVDAKLSAPAKEISMAEDKNDGKAAAVIPQPVEIDDSETSAPAPSSVSG
jgi:hypothetical protein